MSLHEGDAYLIEAVRAGEARAWRELIDRYQGRLLSFARRMLAQPSDAEDLVQETFLGLLRSLPNFDSDRSLETYLFAILRNKLHDQFRRGGRAQQRQSLDTLEADEQPRHWVSTDSPSAHAIVREQSEAQRAALARCLRTYADQCQTQGRFQELIVIEMLVVLGMRNRDVAADLGMTETAVAGVKFRVLERWRELAQDAPSAHEWQEADLAADSTVAAIWREEGISCPKRSTLGRFLLGALEEEWRSYIEFHVSTAACDRCQANLDDLREHEQRDEAAAASLRERCFNSSVGFLSQRPQA